METDKLGEINRKIAEIKKRILLSEGQKTANTAEFQKQQRINVETIATLKKEIKELTIKCGHLKNPLQRPLVIKEPDADVAHTSGKSSSSSSSATAATTGQAAAHTLPTIQVGRVNYPVGAKSPDEAIYLTDLKLTENRKQLDLLRHRFKCRRQQFDRLLQQRQELQACKEYQSQAVGEKPPETLEEDANRKLVCQLENEIHRTNVQWMEAEHIRKKYRNIQASLMNDAERFERSLRELEAAHREQRTEISRLQQVYNEALEMRDAAKVVLQRQEQQANLSQKTRERQAIEYRKQVELRKLELERIGRKLFFEGKSTLLHQDSIGSSSGDQLTGRAENAEDEAHSLLESTTSDMDSLFKLLMEVTGATSPTEVLERYRSQKESAARLLYLRKAAETEKNQLEAQREELSKELEASKFTDVKESEVNQEVIEKMKADIGNFEAERQKNQTITEKTLAVLKFIKERLYEIIYKFQEVVESEIIELVERQLVIKVEQLPDFLMEKATNADLIQILKMKLQHGQELSKKQEQQLPEIEELQLEDEELFAKLEKPTPTAVAEIEKPPPAMPMCYFNLLTGRQRGAGTLSSSPEQAPQAVAATDEESEVPSRNYLKRQSVVIVEAKSRRKPFRPTAGGRRK